MQIGICIWTILVLCLLPVFVVGVGYTQDSELIQSMLDIGEEGHIEIESWIESLWELTHNPVNLNSATVQELLQIPFIHPELAQEIVRYRSRVAAFSHITDLSQVPGMSDEIYEAIQPMLIVKRPSFSPGIVYRFQTRLETPQREGYRSNDYHNPVYLQHRILFHVNSYLRGGIIWEKDAGEENMFDYGSFHLQYRHPGKGLSVLAGDYYKKVGLGLILWTPYGRPLSLQSLPSNQNLWSHSRGNQSTREVGYLRGISLEYQVRPNLRLDIFYSSKSMDASISEDSRYVRSIYSSGLHRTTNEKEKLRRLRTTLWGICLNTQFSSFRMQTSAILNRFQPSLKDQQLPLNYISHSYQIHLGSFKPAGEFALFSGKYPALQQHFYFSEGAIKFEFSCFYYHRKYFAQFSRGFGSFQSPASNRMGAAVVLLYKYNHSWKFGANFYIRRKNYDSQCVPSIPRDYAFELRYKKEKHSLSLRWRLKIRSGDTDDNGKENSYHACRLDHVYKPARNLRLHHRVESHWTQSYLSFARNTAISIYQQVDWRMIPWNFFFRWTTFEIPSYDLRIYEYETDLPGNFRSVLLNGRGYKFFVIVRWAQLEKLQINFKYSQRLYPDQNSIGSGLDEILSNRIQEFRLSILLKY